MCFVSVTLYVFLWLFFTYPFFIYGVTKFHFTLNMLNIVPLVNNQKMKYFGASLGKYVQGLYAEN